MGWITDANGNVFGGYPNNRAGRRALARARGRVIPEQPAQLRPRVMPRFPRLLALYSLLVALLAASTVQAAPALSQLEKLKLALGIARIGGGSPTNYYVDFVNGSDANNGLGPDASAGTNKPWKTLTKALGAAGIASTDTVYLSPAGPFRETISIAMTSAVAETKIIGDYGNAQGFKTSGGVAVAPAPVIVSAYTTNDKTAPSATTLLNLQGRDFLTFQNIQFSGGNAIIVTATTATSTNIKFTDCAFLPGFTNSAAVMSVTTAFATALNWTIDRCYFGPTQATQALLFTLTTGVGADYDANVVIQNCLFLASGSGRAITVQNSGTAANNGGGVKARNCTYFGNVAFMLTTAALRISTTFPCTVTGCFLTGQNILNAATSGQIVEDYNLLVGLTPRTNVSTGTHSISDGSYSPLYHMGQERIWGSPIFKPFGEPMQGSPLLGFGSDGNQTAYDLANLQRPAGGGSANPAVGALDRHNNWITDPSPIGGATTPIKITGPGDQAFIVPVPARAITITVLVKWDATYAGTKPQFVLDANPLNGVATQTATAAGSSGGAGETLTLGPFTPTKAGFMVTVRVKSNDTNGAGVVEADNFSVTG